MKMAESSPKAWKTLWEKDIFLVSSNFSFSNSVFRRFLKQTSKNKSKFCHLREGLTKAPHAVPMLGWWKIKSLVKKGTQLWKKNKHFELSPSIVYIALWIVNTYFMFPVYIFSNNRDITKCQSFCTTTTTVMTMMTPRLQQYLWFSPKTAKQKKEFVLDRNTCSQKMNFPSNCNC